MTPYTTRLVPANVARALDALHGDGALDVSDAEIEDLRRHYYRLDQLVRVTLSPEQVRETGRINTEAGAPFAKAFLAENDAPLYSRVAPAERQSGDDAEARFLAYARPAFHRVTVIPLEDGGHRVVGSPTVQWGDGDGFGFAPVMELNEAGAVTSMRELALPGYPMCGQALPR